MDYRLTPRDDLMDRTNLRCPVEHDISIYDHDHLINLTVTCSRGSGTDHLLTHLKISSTREWVIYLKLLLIIEARGTLCEILVEIPVFSKDNK